MGKLKRVAISLLAGCSLFTVGSGCQVEAWKLALGPVFNGETLYGGVEIELNNGFDFIIPIAPLGDNFGGGWLK